MSAVQPTEIQPGIVIHLDPAILRRNGGCETNAKRTSAKDHAVTGEHYFLILELCDENGKCIAAPLFSEDGKDKVLLRENLKVGEPNQWAGGIYHVFKWQLWRIPLRLVPLASGGDTSEPTTRRYYAMSEPGRIAEMASWRIKAREPFRPV